MIIEIKDAGLFYNWPAIEQAAIKQAIPVQNLLDFAFENIAESMTEEQLIAAYKEWVRLNKEVSC